jgi:acyl-coenzyme A thioesterase PaaI-like protein
VDHGTEEWRRIVEVAAELVVQTRVEVVHHCVEIDLRIEFT